MTFGSRFQWAMAKYRPDFLDYHPEIPQDGEYS